MIAPLAGCGGKMPKLFWGMDEGDRGSGGTHAAEAPSRPPLVVPPQLRGKVELPMADQVAREQGALAQAHIAPATKRLVAGKAVALDARVYPVTPAELFSAALDAMTALNIPVESVDSPSGTITSDWVRKDAASATTTMLNIFGAGPPLATRYRFVVRVLRQQVEGKAQARLEVRTLAQIFTNRHWVNRPMRRKVSNELFSAVEERLAASPPAAGSD
ncbi:MAG: hypothetical protein D6682_06875 [Zetaproteobacteria bacterium]|nr:MAG: hypothetical protein D6682_06875 [Zetaproteobacteria bacterium]